MTTIFNSTNTNIGSDKSSVGNGVGSKNYLTQQIKNALKSLDKDLDQISPHDSHQFRTRLKEIINLTNAFDRQEQIEQQTLAKITQQLRLAKDAETLLNQAVSQISQIFDVERVLIYTFHEKDKGIVAAEALREGFTPAIREQIAPLCFGLANANHYKQVKVVAIADVQQAELSPYQLQLMERFQVKASLAIPIMSSGQIWGLLVIHQCLTSRQWKDTEIRLLEQVSTELSVQLQIAQVKAKLQQEVKAQQSLAKVIENLRQPFDLNTLYKVAVQEVRKLLNSERVMIYKFRDESYSGGDFIAEAELAGFPKLVGSGWEDSYLHDHEGGRFRQDSKASYVCDDIYDGSLSECHIETLESFGIKSFAIVGLYQKNQLWGLLAAYQNTRARTWTEAEIELLQRVASQIGLALEQDDNLEQIKAKNLELDKLAKQEQTLIRVFDKIRQPFNIDGLFKTATQEVRKLLNIERVVIYKFRDESYSGGDFIAEAELAGFPKLVGSGWEDSYLHDHQGGRFRQNPNASYVCNDVHNGGLSECHIETLDSFGIKSFAIVGIFTERKLWGLLATYQNTSARDWLESEVELLKRISAQIGVALEQVEVFEQVNAQNVQLAKIAEREKSLTKVIENIRQTLDIKNTFRTTTKEVRSILNCDRVAIYKFNPDWSGYFIAESFGRGWESLIDKQERIPNLQESVSDCQGIRSMTKRSLRFSDDTFLQETQGGLFRDGQVVKRDDIYKAGFTPCYIEVLEEYQAKAYIIAPVFLGAKLWGLLAAFQNTEPRPWERGELNVLSQVAIQLGVAVQQAQYIEELQQQSAQISELAEQRVGFAKLIYQMGQQSPTQIQDGSAVKALFRLATAETRRLFKTDRVAIYQFHPDWSGDYIVEDVGQDWTPIVGTSLQKWDDTHLQENQGGRYAKNESIRIDNIYTQGFHDCHVELLEQYQAKAFMIAPIFNGEKLWGLLAAYHNKEPRSWSENELRLLNQVASQVGVVIQRRDDLQELDRQRQKLAEAAEREKTDKERLQKETLRLLRSIEPALRGDLTVTVPLWEDEIGTIADGYNTTLQTLRELVRQVKVSAEKVDRTCNTSTSAVGQLSEQAQKQSQELQQALQELQQMVDSIAQVAVNAQQVDRAVLDANRTVQAGDSIMEETVAGIGEIRETVAETAKKLKNLGESSQKIAKVVSLIDNFANQTNLLAINAAIEATRAGEYGRGFGVVADEIRTLAYQSANATNEIERLVQEIRTETQSVTEAMELGIMRVVKGTELVNKTRQSLDEIKSATKQISDRVQHITTSTSTQTKQSQLMTKAMTDVADIASQTSSNSVKIASLFEELLSTSEQLQTSISKFKID